MDTELYSIGAFFSDEHPELVDEVVRVSGEIERDGLVAYADASGRPIEEAFETLLTGLARCVGSDGSSSSPHSSTRCCRR